MPLLAKNPCGLAKLLHLFGYPKLSAQPLAFFVFSIDFVEKYFLKKFEKNHFTMHLTILKTQLNNF